MRTRRFAIVLFLILSTTGLFAQVIEFERVLLPISAPEVGGAFGSRWVTEHFVRNDGSTVVQLMRDDCGGPACLVPVGPGVSFRANPAQRKDRLWLSVEKDRAGQMFFSTVVRDISKTVEPWGTKIPSVFESEFRQDRLQLLNVPSDLDFRKNLRVYLIPQIETGGPFEIVLAVRVFNLEAELNSPGTRQLLSERLYTLPTSKFEENFDYLPIFDLDAAFPGLQAATERLRVEVERVSGYHAKLWALLTVTNNETQHVTIFTP